MTPPPYSIEYSGYTLIVYLAICPAPVVFALNSAFFIVLGVFVITLTGLDSVFKEESIPS